MIRKQENQRRIPQKPEDLGVMLRPEVTCGQKAIEFVDRLQELIGLVDSRRELPLPSCVLHSLQRARNWFRVEMQGEFPVAAMIGMVRDLSFGPNLRPEASAGPSGRRSAVSVDP